ncbi:hypothetical protein [Brachybacterium sacelli]|uniref:hypothetical protein n=1 Tax=Brachybacterium sacelli TaxID=173364 RepID=UPI003608624E
MNVTRAALRRLRGRVPRDPPSQRTGFAPRAATSGRHGCVMRAQRTDIAPIHATTTTKGRSPGRERTDQTGQ